MSNPGIAVFAFGTIRSPGHPLNIDPYEDDPYLDKDGNDSDYMPPVSFGRWRTPGQTTRVPTQVGPPFAPGETPEDVLHGEVISPEEEAGADGILNGEHESDQPSENPDVESARQDLHTPESAIAVSTLARLLNGAHPDSMGQGAMDAAHAWLSKRFTGLSVNPNHGTLVAASPTGGQMVKRESASTPEESPAYTLVNKHGKFESKDPERVVKALVAFQIMHNEIARKKKKKEEDGLTSTSGLFNRMVDAFREGYSTPYKAPEGAVFEPGNGTEFGEKGVRGGYVMPARHAPSDWHVSGGTAYSPGHSMRLMLDPNEATKVREDPRFKGHTFTYVPSGEHTTPRQLGGINYYVRDGVHPAARGNGFDLPQNAAPRRPQREDPRPVSSIPARQYEPEPRLADDFTPQNDEYGWWVRGGEDPPMSRRSSVQANDLCPVCASGYLEPYDSDFHECLNCGSLVKHVGFEKKVARNYEDEPTEAELDDLFAEHDRLGDEYDRYRKEHGVAHPDDWSDLPAGETRSIQYRRTPDGLVEHHWEDDLFPHEATKSKPRSRGGLGRGLTGPNQIPDAEFRDKPNPFYRDPTDGSENPDAPVIDLDETMAHHPLAGEELPEDYEGYVAPRNRVQFSAAFSEAEHAPKLNTQASEEARRGLYWRSFPSSVAPDLVPGHDAHNAEQQIREAEDNFGGGLGRWWSPTREGAAFYGGHGTVLVGARIDPSALRDPEHSSGLIARRPTPLVVEHVAVGEPDGSWTDLEVPPGLTSWTHRPVDHISSAADPIDEFMGKHGFQPIHKPGQSRAYVMPLVGAEGGTYARLTEGVPKADGNPSGWSLTADSVPEFNFTRNNRPTSHIPIDRNVVENIKMPATFRQVLPDAQNRSVGKQTFLASGAHPIEDDTLNRAIRDVAQHGRRSRTFWNAINQSSYEMPDLPPGAGTQREKRHLSSRNPGLSRFAVWDATEVNEDPCTHCSGSGVDPEYGDQCEHCEGSGNEPE